MRTLSRIVLAALLTGAVLAPSFPAARAEEPLTPNAAASTILDRGKADIIQLSGLRVESVNRYRYQPGTELADTSLPVAVVTAVSENPACVRFETEASVRSLPCLAIATRQYQIRVTSGTRLLDRVRKAIAIEDVAVGDTVNVFGYADRNTGLIDARILRDTDQPAVARFVQLNDLRVIGVLQTDRGVEFDAVRTMDHCYLFQASQRLSAPCPPGMMPADNVRSAQEAAASSLGIPRYLGVHHVVVPGDAVILDVSRRPLAAKAIQVGATVNVAGTMRGAGSDLIADVVRVTSADSARSLVLTASPPSLELRVGQEAESVITASGGSGTYAWTASGLPDGLSLQAGGVTCAETPCMQPIIYCITSPCPMAPDLVVRIVGAPTSAGTFAATVTAKDGAGRVGQLTLPITVLDAIEDEAIEVRVETDRSSYDADDTVGIDVTATNITRRTQTRELGGCQASYDVLPGFSLRSVQLCAAVVTELRLRPGETETWHFEHDLSAHARPEDADRREFTVVGYVEGVGQASTRITVRR